ncbi:MORC3 protein, partial [Polypterus senegalus]
MLPGSSALFGKDGCKIGERNPSQRDNAYDPDVAAKHIWIDKTIIKKNDCLTFMDDGNGMNRDMMHKMLSFGFSDKVTVKGHVPVGLYGNGFKSGSMRLGKDAIVFKLQKTSEESKASLEAILKYSLFNSEKELTDELKAIGKRGTRIIIWNLRRSNDGRVEFDFDTNKYDIRIPDNVLNNEKYKRQDRMDQAVPESDYSLRLLHSFQKNKVTFTFGYNTKSKEQYGIMMYHRNRLIKAYERVGCQLKANNCGVGVIGITECNFLKPTHNKQDFDYTNEYRLTMQALGSKLWDYWNEMRYKRKNDDPFSSVPVEDTEMKRTLQTYLSSPDVKKLKLNEVQRDLKEHEEDLDILIVETKSSPRPSTKADITRVKVERNDSLENSDMCMEFTDGTVDKSTTSTLLQEQHKSIMTQTEQKQVLFMKPEAGHYEMKNAKEDECINKNGIFDSLQEQEKSIQTQPKTVSQELLNYQKKVADLEQQIIELKEKCVKKEHIEFIQTDSITEYNSLLKLNLNNDQPGEHKQSYEKMLTEMEKLRERCKELETVKQECRKCRLTEEQSFSCKLEDGLAKQPDNIFRKPHISDEEMEKYKEELEAAQQENARLRSECEVLRKHVESMTSRGLTNMGSGSCSTAAPEMTSESMEETRGRLKALRINVGKLLLTFVPELDLEQVNYESDVIDEMFDQILDQLAPKFLHTNSTSHTWPFSAIAELIDNAYDPDVAAKHIWIEKTIIKKNDCLTFMDDGNGMNRDMMHKMLSFGFSDKVTVEGHVPVGLYGNGFKSGSMRLGKDAIVFSKSDTTMSIGLLSQSYLEAIEAEHVFKTSEESKASLEAILKYSLFNSEKELTDELKAIREQGTRIIIWNLRKSNDGRVEFDFDTDKYDIRIPDDVPNNEKYKRQDRVDQAVPESDYSLRKNKVTFTFGYNTKSKEQYGIMMYHRNRLIKAYERVGCQLKANNCGVGVIGITECNFLKPTHNKQDFDYTDEYRLTIQALGSKLGDYWKEMRYKRKNEDPFSSVPVEDTVTQPDQNWVQCDECRKWRKLPDGIDTSELPDNWYCHMNPDTQFSAPPLARTRGSERHNPKGQHVPGEGPTMSPGSITAPWDIFLRHPRRRKRAPLACAALAPVVPPSWVTIGAPAERPLQEGRSLTTPPSAPPGFGPVEKGKRGPEALPGHSSRAPCRSPYPQCSRPLPTAPDLPAEVLRRWFRARPPPAAPPHRQLAQPPRGLPLPAQRMAFFRRAQQPRLPIGGTGIHPSVPPSFLTR